MNVCVNWIRQSRIFHAIFTRARKLSNDMARVSWKLFMTCATLVAEVFIFLAKEGVNAQNTGINFSSSMEIVDVTATGCSYDTGLSVRSLIFCNSTRIEFLKACNQRFSINLMSTC